MWQHITGEAGLLILKFNNKKHILMFSTIIIGLIISTVVFAYDFKSIKESLADEIYRNEAGEGDKNVSLYAEYLGVDEKIDFILSEREYSASELDEFVKVLDNELIKIVLAGNEVSDKVIYPLSLVSSVNGYPFYIRWEISDTDVIDVTGELLCDPSCAQTHDITLKAYLSYKNYRNELRYRIVVIPYELTKEAMVHRYLVKDIENRNESLNTNKSIKLPSKINDTDIKWKRPVNRRSFIILAGAFMVAMLLGWAYERDELNKTLKARELLEDVYPDFTDKLRLYIMSGLNARNAFFKIGEDIKNKNSSSYDELKRTVGIANNLFVNGRGQEQVFEEFGQLCGGSYKKLSFMLSVNLKRGNDQLISLLNEESQKALIYRKERAKRRCDEASVKLLFPMMLMLIVVMILIMLPAYFGINN